MPKGCRDVCLKMGQAECPRMVRSRQGLGHECSRMRMGGRYLPARSASGPEPVGAASRDRRHARPTFPDRIARERDGQVFTVRWAEERSLTSGPAQHAEMLGFVPQPNLRYRGFFGAQGILARFQTLGTTARSSNVREGGSCPVQRWCGGWAYPRHATLRTLARPHRTGVLCPGVGPGL